MIILADLGNGNVEVPPNAILKTVENPSLVLQAVG